MVKMVQKICKPLRRMLPKCLYTYLAKRFLDICDMLLFFKVVPLKFAHKKVLKEIKKKVIAGCKIRVLFLVSDVSKWKLQPLYDEMRESDFFEPIVGVMRQDSTSASKSVREISEKMDAADKYYKCLGCNTVMVYNPQTMQRIDLKTISPDIVFYQQPWNLSWTYGPDEISAFALPCYIPYHAPNYIDRHLLYQLDFHRFLAYYFLTNKHEDDVRKQGVSSIYHSGKFYVVGHPIFDVFNKAKHDYNSRNRLKLKRVIYAPHFSIKHPLNKCPFYFSTFLETGRWMLEYAKRHPEISWVFRPHPSLLTAMKNTHAWKDGEIESYYSEWGKIGEVSVAKGYIDLFMSASALITDCASFLTEFALTERPIIHLISGNPTGEAQRYFHTYYRATTLGELSLILHDVIENDNDSMRTVRLAALKNANFFNQCASKNIVKVLTSEIKGIDRVG